MSKAEAVTVEQAMRDAGGPSSSLRPGMAVQPKERLSVADRRKMADYMDGVTEIDSGCFQRERKPGCE